MATPPDKPCTTSTFTCSVVARSRGRRAEVVRARFLVAAGLLAGCGSPHMRDQEHLVRPHESATCEEAMRDRTSEFVTVARAFIQEPPSRLNSLGDAYGEPIERGR